ncbi:MAG: ATP-binding protein [Promethearchaeota archaeon]
MSYNINIKLGRCNICNQMPVIHRKYSKIDLCPKCFIKNVEKRIESTILGYNLIKNNDKVIVGLSGGKDSSVLLYNLKKFRDKSKLQFSIIALSLDEGIEGYRPNSLKKAKQLCNELGIQHEIISFKEKIGKSLEEIISIMKTRPDYKYSCNYCATIRRRLLNDVAMELGGDVLALGHNLTDLSETFLMNILHRRINLIRNQFLLKQDTNETKKFFIKKIMPLMKIPEEEIFLYANLKKLTYYDSHCPFREKDPILRKRVLEFIQEAKVVYPEIEFNIFDDFIFLSKLLYEESNSIVYYKCSKCGYPSGVSRICMFCKIKESIG